MKLLCIRWFLACLTMGVSATTVADQQKLVILNWSDYIDETLLEQFQHETGIQVQQAFYETDDTRDERLLETGGHGYDIVIVNGLKLSAYHKQGWLAKLSFSSLPNLKHIAPRWRKAYPIAENFAVPYLWGTMGIAYRSDLTTKPVDSWQALFHPEPAVQGKILMIKTVRDVMASALKALGHSVNTTNKADLNAAEELLIQQRPYVSQFGYTLIGTDAKLVSGEYAMAVVYNGDALSLQAHNPNIQYVLPKEGSTIWSDYLVVMSASKNKGAAWKLINFLNQPKHAAQLSQTLNFASPNTAAIKLLPKEVISNSVIYPSEAVLAKSEFLQALPPRILNQQNLIFSHLVALPK